MKYRIRTYSELEKPDVSDLPGQIRGQRARLERRLEKVRRVVAVTSGKGGVGKSLVAAGISAAATSAGWRTGLLDADLNGPTSARMLGLGEARLTATEDGMVPPASATGVRLVSTDLLLRANDPLRWSEPESGSFVWRGAGERGLLREFLSDVEWGELDLLVVDLPPGPGRLEQLAGLVTTRLGAVAVTLPAGASRSSVERSLRLARELELPVLGVVQNMSGYACGRCGSTESLFPGAAGRDLASAFDVPLLGEIPFDPAAAERADAGEMGRLVEETAAGRALAALAEVLRRRVEDLGTRGGAGDG